MSRNKCFHPLGCAFFCHAHRFLYARPSKEGTTQNALFQEYPPHILSPCLLVFLLWHHIPYLLLPFRRTRKSSLVPRHDYRRLLCHPHPQVYNPESDHTEILLLSVDSRHVLPVHRSFHHPPCQSR